MTEHIEAKIEDIAKTVIMPGDPLRAKYIAEHYLENYKLINTLRNNYAYTGTYKDKKITVMSSGMGMPSMGIYSYELYKFYNVENIIRIGTAGAYTKELNLYDILLEEKCYSESSYAKTQNNTEDNILYSSKYLNNIILDTSKELYENISLVTIHSSDVFYKENDNFKDLYNKYHCMACEMESFALFHNANILNKKAACILTVSNNLVTRETTTGKERETTLDKMIKLSLETAINL